MGDGRGRAVRGRTVRWRRVGGDVFLASVIVLSGNLEPGVKQHDVEPRWRPDVLVVNLVAIAVLLLSRRYPRAALGALLGLTVLTVPLGLYNIGTVTAVAVAVYVVSTRTDRRTATLLTIGVALLVTGLALAVGVAGPQFLLVVCLGGALGDAIRTQQAAMAAVTERAERAERTREAVARQRVAEERLAIARDLHDVVAHQIAVINLHAGVAAGAVRTRPDDAERALATIRQASRTVLSEIGDLLATLREPGAAAAVGLAHLDDVVRGLAADGLQVTVRRDGDLGTLPSAVDVVALRVVQEALTNAHKHGADRHAHVRLQHHDQTLTVTVTNACAPQTTGPGTRHGLLGMAERVESVRGTLTAGPTSGTWTVRATLPTAATDVEEPAT